MKKALLSLIMAFVCLPTVFAQANADHVFVTLDTSTCTPFQWVNGVTYSNDTTATYTNGDTTFVLYYHFGGLLNLYNSVTEEVFGECSATFNGKTYTRTNTYRDTIHPLVGCDSIIKVKVILAKTDSVLTRTSCGSFTAPWGTTYTESVTILDTNITSATDPTCNYNFSLTLTVNPQYLNQQVQIADGGCAYIWHHGTKTDTIVDLLSHCDTLTTVGNCDSIVTLTVNTFSGHRYDTTVVAACDFYKPTWRDTIFVSGNYDQDTDTDTTGNYHADANGHKQCIIHRTLHLTIDNTLTDTAQVAIVDVPQTGCRYIWGDVTVTDTNKTHYQLFHTLAANCDSLAAIRVLSYTGHEYDTLFASSCDTLYQWKRQSHYMTSFTRQDIYNTTGQSYVDTTAVVVLQDTVAHCTNHYVLKLKFYSNQSNDKQSVCDTNFMYRFRRYNQTSHAWVWDTAWFNTTGDYTTSPNGDTLYSRSNKGCLTARTLKLKIKAPVLSYRADTAITVTGCNSVQVLLNGEYTPKIYHNCDTTLSTDPSERTYEKCYDSLIILHVVVNHSTIHTTNVQACDSYYWDVDTTTYTHSVDKYVRLGLNADGCEDSAHLVLTINPTPVVTINGEWALGVPNEGTTLHAVADMPIKTYNWYINNALQSTHTDSLVVPAVTENTDVRLEATSQKNCTAVNWITITTNVGIDDVEGLQVNLYPNPTSRFLNLESAQGIHEVVIYNTVGQQVITRNGNGNHLVLDLGSLATGHYTLRILGADGNSTTRTFIVNK
ncbi:MAG: T9SS type A sorting domain-containing protein [Bacteroidales bacterium]|nr:T9SS type A sorting domain-containing protein [Bacteroidales bacterium]